MCDLNYLFSAQILRMNLGMPEVGVRGLMLNVQSYPGTLPEETIAGNSEVSLLEAQSG